MTFCLYVAEINIYSRPLSPNLKPNSKPLDTKPMTGNVKVRQLFLVLPNSVADLSEGASV